MRKNQAIFTLIFISGFAGLIYQIVWTRQLTLLFGVSIYAVSAVVAVFLLGLAAGSYLFGRIADRAGNPLVIFGIIELSIAGYALVFPFIATMMEALYVSLYDIDYSRPAIFSLRFSLTLLLLIVPTLLMGGTLPVAARLRSSQFNRFGNTLAMLYGLNTLGAVFGAGLAGFFLLRWLGVSGATYIAIVFNSAVGAVALSMSRNTATKLHDTGARERAGKAKKKNQLAQPVSASVRRKILIAIFVAGFCALGYEVLWTKMLILILGNSSWAFSTVLVAYLASIAAGSLLIAPWLDRKFDRVQLFSFLQMLIAITAFLSLLAFRWLAVAKIGSGSSGLTQAVFAQFLVACLIIAPPMLLSGAAFPLAARLCASRPEKAGTQLGLTLAFNTAGSVLGSLAAGYLLIAKFGVQNSIILLAVINAILGTWLLFIKSPRARKIGFVKKGAAVVLSYALFMALFLYKPPLTLPPKGYDLKYYREDAAGIFSIFQEKSTGIKFFNINNINEVTTHSSSIISFRLMAYLPYMLHENSRDALVITFGAGIVAGSLAQLDLNTLDCVEINPKARDVGRYFAAENHDVTANPKLNLFIEDGRNFLLTTSRKYDIITADATHPTGADSWVLFTKEYYELCRQRLEDGGLFLQWLPLHALSEDYYQTILATAAEVFDDLSIWFTGLDEPIGHTILIGTKHPFVIDYERIRAKMQQPAIRSDLAKVGIDSPESLLSHFLTDKNNLQAALKNRAINTDNLAITAFPDALNSPDWWADNLAYLAGNRASPAIINMPSDSLDAFQRLHRASGWLIDAALAASAGDLRRVNARIDRIKDAGVNLEKLSLAFSSSARQIIDYYLFACEQAIAVNDTAGARQFLEKAQVISRVLPGGDARLDMFYTQIDQNK
jgi:spermidine synthase